MGFQNLRRRFLLSLGLSIAVLAGLMAYGDVTQVMAALAGFRWELTPLILGLTLLNYLLRFLKWQFYLRQIGVRGLGWWQSFLIFSAGMAMVITPGKVGEWLKSYLLRELAATPLTRSAPIIVAERLSDGLAMLLLATGGLLLFPVGWQALGIIGLGSAVFLAVVWYRPLADAIFTAATGLRPLSSRVHYLRALYDSTQTLLHPQNLAFAVFLGFISWGAECVAFWLVLLGLGVEGGPLLVVQAAFILASATLGGALFLTPGGLGVAEGGIIGLAQLLLALPLNIATTAALLIRLCTLWFGVALGLVALFLVSQRLPILRDSALPGGGPDGLESLPGAGVPGGAPEDTSLTPAGS